MLTPTVWAVWEFFRIFLGKITGFTLPETEVTEVNCLVVEPTHLKNMLVNVKWEIFPK